MKFYLGVHRPYWLWDERFADVPLFLSHNTLRHRRSAFPRAVTDWALDSGGFSELDRHSTWLTPPGEYIDAVYRYREELGRLQWASPQDWMCEPWMTAKTGLSVEEHQRRTVANFLHLRDLAPELPFIPVLQGWEIGDYERCLDLYREAGVDLHDYPTVGVGSVCRRQATDDIGAVMTLLTGEGLSLHGFGVKSAGVRRYGHLLSSADSMAWSTRARRAAMDRERLGLSGSVDGCDKRTCNNCAHFALDWRDRVLASL